MSGVSIVSSPVIAMSGRSGHHAPAAHFSRMGLWAQVVKDRGTCQMNLRHEGIYLYVIVCRNDSFYVGVTNNLERRFLQHMTEIGATKTRAHGVVRIVTAYLFSSRQSALKAEVFVTRLLQRCKPSTTTDEAVEELLNHRYAAQQYRHGSSWDVERAWSA